MTATKELRRMLDERGVEYESETDEDGWAFTRWHGFDDTGWLAASDELCGLLDLRGRYLFTPEQAIAATLGRGECHDVCASVSEFTCSECGFNCDLTSWISLFDGDEGRHRHHHHGTPNYCPNCGAKVVDA